MVWGLGLRVQEFPDPWEDPNSISLNGGSYKVPLVVWGPKLGDLLSRSSLKGSELGVKVRAVILCDAGLRIQELRRLGFRV